MVILLHNIDLRGKSALRGPRGPPPGGGGTPQTQKCLQGRTEIELRKWPPPEKQALVRGGAPPGGGPPPSQNPVLGGVALRGAINPDKQKPGFRIWMFLVCLISS